MSLTRDGRLLRYSTGQRAPAWLYTSYRVYLAAAGISNLPRSAPLARGEPISAIIRRLVHTGGSWTGFSDDRIAFFRPGPATAGYRRRGVDDGRRARWRCLLMEA